MNPTAYSLAYFTENFVGKNLTSLIDLQPIAYFSATKQTHTRINSFLDSAGQCFIIYKLWCAGFKDTSLFQALKAYSFFNLKPYQEALSLS